MTRRASCIFAALLAAAAPAAGQGASGIPKRIILMVADGSGFNTFLASDYFENGAAGSGPCASFDVALACSTYPLHKGSAPGSGGYLGRYDPAATWSSFLHARSNATDSAAAATALATGSKTYRTAVAWTDFNMPVLSILRHAMARGRSGGLVTSVALTHSTPAAFVAHNVSRKAGDAIALEMLTNTVLRVLMGCGHPGYDDHGTAKASGFDYTYVGSPAMWNSLTAGTAGGPNPWSYIESPAQFDQLAAGASIPNRVCGVARAISTLQANRPGNVFADPFAVPLNTNVPSLATMVRGALNVLNQDSDGFFLVVEGGAIDWAASSNRAGRLIEEQVAFNAAVRAVTNWIGSVDGWTNTLVIVTCDHETGMVWGPASGAGQPNPWDPVANFGAGIMPGLKFNTRDHSNTLVPLYAHGAGAGVLSGYARKTDPVYGPYADNTDVFKTLRRLLLGPGAKAGDFDGNRREDLGVFWRATGTWYVLTDAGALSVPNWIAGQVPVPADYDGDGLADYASFHPPTATWTIFQSGLAGTRQQAFGSTHSLPVPGDYDGDGRADFATFEPSTAKWRILFSASGHSRTQNWGWSSTVPVPADYDGDGETDLGVYDRAGGNWYVMSLRNGLLALGSNWGWSAAVPVPADYDGDLRADFAVYHPATGNWYVRRLSGGVLAAGSNWGWSEAVPAPMDYDGDGRAELAVHWRPGGSWYIRRVTGQTLAAGANWGWSDTEPVIPQYQILRVSGMLP